VQEINSGALRVFPGLIIFRGIKKLFLKGLNILVDRKILNLYTVFLLS